MRPWTKDDELRFAVAYALRRMRPLLRRIVLETHADEHTDPANAAADRLLEHLRLCGYRGSRDKNGRQREAGGSVPARLAPVLRSNLYSLTRSQAEIRLLARAMRDTKGNLPPRHATPRLVARPELSAVCE